MTAAYRLLPRVVTGALLTVNWLAASQAGAGSVRGTVQDADFGVPLPLVRVELSELELRVETDNQGGYLFEAVPPGQYTLVFWKPGYVRQVKTDVVVASGRLSEVDVSLAGEFTEMEELVVQDVQVGAGTEAALLELRFDSPAMMDSVSSDLMSRAGASDAAGALRLVSGATVTDGKFAVIRGLPDRYVSSQMNGVRLPSADEDTRAVELDQFPSPVLESIQVTKTFTPDQQGDASGGAVDVRLKGIPEERVAQLKGQIGLNTAVLNETGFVTYSGGGVDFWGRGADSREPQAENTDWTGPIGITKEDSPDFDWKGSGAFGNKFVLDDVILGAFGSFFYERDSSHRDEGKDDSKWVESPGAGMTPKYSQGAPSQGDFLTSLFDVQRSTDTVQWGGLATLGLETEDHAVGLTFLYTHAAEDKAILAEDTRGKDYYFPGYEPNNPNDPGNAFGRREAAPYLRTETLEYTERTSSTLQLHGEHTLELGDREWGSFLFHRPTLRWYAASSKAGLDQPDKRQFGSAWLGANNGFPPFVPPEEAVHIPYKPAANFTIGNLQRIFKTINEESDQFGGELEWPLDQWDGEEGSVRLGLFSDQVDRSFDQDTYSNFGDNGASYNAGWNEFWSEVFVSEGGHEITSSQADVDYEGEQDVRAVYSMVDLPLSGSTTLIAGARFESSDVSTVNDAEPFAEWFPPGATQGQILDPGEADADFSEDDFLPSIGIVSELSETVTVRASYSQTVARQTFKELTPILQQEFLGGPVFIGNPTLGMAGLDNLDLRIDYVPYPGGLLSLSFFHKSIDDPIEYIQVPADFNYTTARNYPEGRLHGYELELRQDIGEYVDELQGVSLGLNATLIDSKVDLPRDEINALASVQAPTSSRDMTNAPEYLLNLYSTWDVDERTRLGLFYTLQGDTLVAGAGTDNNLFVPSVYAKEFGTLNFSASRAFDDGLKLEFKAKNLTDPVIREVYRSEYVPGGDETKTSYQRGMEFSISLGISF